MSDKNAKPHGPTSEGSAVPQYEIEGRAMRANMEKLRALRAKRPELILEVDGGVNRETAPICRENGADVAVAGTAVFRAENIPAEIALLRGE